MNHPASPNLLEHPLAQSAFNIAAVSPGCAVARLCHALDASFDGCAGAPDPSHRASFAKDVRAALAEAAADPLLLTGGQREGAATCYRRHLLAADPLGRYAIAALVWMPGQASPIHAHHTWCGYAMIDGTLTETVYDWNAAADAATPVREQSREPGAVSFTRAGRAGIHRLGNVSDTSAISLHIYGVPGEQITTHVNDIVRVARSAPAVIG
ncbi:cysteine dioxygenase family protein [Paraburkholderia sp. LEh10]|uniref:cysteine dioxygenase family protein n=1 Tax=Paraburkholderia sp. LEh10 TaxID=2821353 RepID=UPI001AE6DF86|nr:cysteine dioxygenase family protein [Paraburkholderia sp. LEh10]MBP0589952.1 cysteine dioxygenase family protein [Paraburkholderia sp. LEh10]